nr:MAG TPA: hypothetical protein [Caudoviricetes sp.]
MIRTSIDSFGDCEFTINLIVYVFMAGTERIELPSLGYLGMVFCH